MKKIIIYSSILMALLAFIGCDACKPDLTIEDLAVGWNPLHRLAKAVIKNIGNSDAGKFTVNFNAYANSVLQAQTSQDVSGLAEDAKTLVKTDFTSLANSANQYLRNVNRIEIVVDSRNMVNESNESNNTKERSISVLPPRVLIIEKIRWFHLPQAGDWLFCFIAHTEGGPSAVYHIPNRSYSSLDSTIKMNLVLNNVNVGQKIINNLHFDINEVNVCTDRAAVKIDNQIFEASLEGSKTFHLSRTYFTLYWHMQ